MSTSVTFEDRVSLQRELRGARWFLARDPATGRDARTGLEVEVDATGWPLRVTRLDLDQEGLRTPDGLRAAVVRAIGAAALAHLVQVGERAAPSEADLARGRELVEGRRRLVPRPTYQAPPVVRPEHPVRTAGSVRDERLDRTATGVSRGGEVHVELGWVDGLRVLRIDPDFLATATDDLVRYAVTEAFVSAQEGTTR